MKKAKIENSMYNVMDFDQFKKAYSTDSVSHKNAVEVDDLIMPVRRVSEKDKPGFHCTDTVAYYVPPTEDEKETYMKSDDNYVDLCSSKSIKELMGNNKKIKDIESGILVSPDDKTVLKISIEDEPLMRALKEAILKKDININKYEDRFGDNFQNDLRLLSGHSITLKKAVSFMNNLDMKATVIIEDSNEDVINPMNDTITTVITGGNNGNWW